MTARAVRPQEGAIRVAKVRKRLIISYFLMSWGKSFGERGELAGIPDALSDLGTAAARADQVSEEWPYGPGRGVTWGKW